MTTNKGSGANPLLPEIRAAFRAVFDTTFVNRGVETIRLDRADGEWKVALRLNAVRPHGEIAVTAVVEHHDSLEAIVSALEKAEDIANEVEAHNARGSKAADGV